MNVLYTNHLIETNFRMLTFSKILFLKYIEIFNLHTEP